MNDNRDVIDEALATGGDAVFQVSPELWQIVVAGKVVRATFNSEGAAKAGIATEKKRYARNQR